MNDLLNTLMENELFETNEKGVFIRKLHGDYYFVKVLIYNEAIANYEIINDSEYFKIEYNGDKSIYNLAEICRNAYNIASIIQNRIKQKRLSLDEIKPIIKQKYPEWIMYFK